MYGRTSLHSLRTYKKITDFRKSGLRYGTAVTIPYGMNLSMLCTFRLVEKSTSLYCISSIVPVVVITQQPNALFLFTILFDTSYFERREGNLLSTGNGTVRTYVSVIFKIYLIMNRLCMFL